MPYTHHIALETVLEAQGIASCAAAKAISNLSVRERPILSSSFESPSKERLRLDATLENTQVQVDDKKSVLLTKHLVVLRFDNAAENYEVLLKQHKRDLKDYMARLMCTFEAMTFGGCLAAGGSIRPNALLSLSRLESSIRYEVMDLRPGGIPLRLFRDASGLVLLSGEEEERVLVLGLTEDDRGLLIVPEFVASKEDAITGISLLEIGRGDGNPMNVWSIQGRGS